jgi:hypothetical protein
VSRDVNEITICGEHRQVVVNAELRKQCIDSLDLYTGSTTAIAQFGRLDVIVPFGDQEGQRSKSLQYLSAILRSGEPLQQLLQDEPGGMNRVTSAECVDEREHLRFALRLVSAESQ